MERQTTEQVIEGHGFELNRSRNEWIGSKYEWIGSNVEWIGSNVEWIGSNVEWIGSSPWSN